MKAVAKDPIAHRDDKDVIATCERRRPHRRPTRAVLLAAPRSGAAPQQIQQAPDSLVNQYVTNMAQREVLLKRADSAKIGLTPEETATCIATSCRRSR